MITVITVLVVGVLGVGVGLLVGGLAGRAAEAAFRARLVRRAVAEQCDAVGVSSPRVVLRRSLAGFEVDGVAPAGRPTVEVQR